MANAALLLRRKRPRPVKPSLISTDGRERVVEPFYLTFFKVGSTILAFSAVTYLVVVVCVPSIYPQTNYEYDVVPYREHLVIKHNTVQVESKVGGKVATLPNFSLTAASENDVFGFAYKHFSHVGGNAPNEIAQFLDAAKKLRLEFSERYGGELSARSLLVRSLKVLKKKNEPRDYLSSSQSNAMTYRLQQATERGVLHIAFGGGEAVAGYGNFFYQSFPFIMESLLKKSLETLGLTLQVHNAAIKQISPFPYTWCRSNHLGEYSDVLGIDFGAISDKNMEQVLRNIIGPLPEYPILVFREALKSSSRLALLQSYVDAGAIVDPIIVDIQAAYAPFANVMDSYLPPGFQQWEEFGAPPGAPGKVRRNLTLKQHELYGWLLTMQVLGGAQILVRNIMEGSRLPPTNASRMLPRPVLATKTMRTSKSTKVLYGRPSDGSDREWTLPSMECRTAFDPIASGALEDIVTGGTAGDESDLLHPKGAMYLSRGWVLDLEGPEKREKQRMKQWDNLGFQDYAKAYYGVAASGPLSLFLPVGEHDENESARDTVQCILVCQSNARTNTNSCNLQTDVTFKFGGVVTPSVQWITDDSVSYRGRRLCLLVDVPEDAKFTSEQEARQGVSKSTQPKLLAVSVNETRRSTSKGLAIEINVTNSLVTWHKGACSIAHVLWES